MTSERDAASATVQAFSDLTQQYGQAILEAAGSSLQHVLRCGVFLIDIREFQELNAVYARMFGEHRPARAVVRATSGGEPRAVPARFVHRAARQQSSRTELWRQASHST